MVAVLVTLGSALAFVVLWMNAGGRKPVLALSTDVAAGQTIQADDLTVVRVSTDAGIDPIPSSRKDDVVGQPAATNLLAGMLLVPDAVGTADGLDADSAVIAIPVPKAEIPTDDLEAGDSVVLVRAVPSSPSSPSDGAASDIIGEGHVFSVQVPDDNSSEIRVSVIVDESAALQIATAVIEEQIYLYKTAGG